jgi:hypothetical protein
MYVKDLIQKLKELPVDTKIVFSSDEEGNCMMEECDLGKEEDTVILFPYKEIEIP